MQFLPPWKQGSMLPKQCEATINLDPNNPLHTKTSACGVEPYQIVSELCEFYEVQSLKIQDLPENVLNGETPNHIMANFTTPLVGKVVPGSRVRLIGVYTCLLTDQIINKQIKSAYIHALGVECFRSGPSISLNFTSSLKEDICYLASTPNIKERIFQSIAPTIEGHEDIKKSLACMLFGGNRKVLRDGMTIRGDIHILLLGDPSTAKSQLLRFVSKASPISVYTSGKGSSAAGLTAALIKNQNGSYALEGGAMVLADGGIVCIDEFDKMRDSDRVAIHEAMEQQTISTSKAGINAVISTECAVLAAGNPTFGFFDSTMSTSEQHNFESTILSRFDAIWLVRDLRYESIDKKIASHIYNIHRGNHRFGDNMNSSSDLISNSSKNTFSFEHLKQYVQYCKTVCKPHLSANAAKYLENFYVEIREQARVLSKKNKKTQIPITVRQLESIARIADSLAKMTLSDVVTEQIVEEAIQIFKLSTLATADTNSSNREYFTEFELARLKTCKDVILEQVPIGSKISKLTLSSKLKSKTFAPDIIKAAIEELVKDQTLKELANNTLKRINVGI
uniref:DNA helicase n=1 Tax=Dermatophagoides pteronyssinus TaxID=6956 RepID=A0A6P6XLR0_DERPT|nr:DNA replication licensing factor MCM5-like [Dermatophagoides pteronyssinus]